MVDLKLVSGNSTSRVVPSPVTFSVRANRGDGVHSTSSKSSECGVPKDMKDGKSLTQSTALGDQATHSLNSIYLGLAGFKIYFTYYFWFVRKGLIMRFRVA